MLSHCYYHLNDSLRAPPSNTPWNPSLTSYQSKYHKDPVPQFVMFLSGIGKLIIVIAPLVAPLVALLLLFLLLLILYHLLHRWCKHYDLIRDVT